MCESWLWVLICNKYYTLYLPQIPAYVGQLRHMPQGAESSRGTLQQELCCQGSNSEGGAQPRKPGKEPGGKKPIVTPSGRTGQFWALNSTPQHSGATHTPSGYPGHSRCPWSHSLVPGNWMSQGPDSPEYGLASFIYFSFKFFQWGGGTTSHLFTYTVKRMYWITKAFFACVNHRVSCSCHLLFSISSQDPGSFLKPLTQVTPSAHTALLFPR